eukprot:CAMPEP_0119282374 /NCGR_PEP_ID=MMETSP1329-20130426/26595_1 /TAXON_ID=114041 /ORGANISM="Genus nov. species nov., Strain RCC1024" /LENGTH=137 /DNA_ID=CAMNT_0007283031 /DNA_START=184 /DNA_END=594 /DNA_ORIENTATION=+
MRWLKTLWAATATSRPSALQAVKGRGLDHLSATLDDGDIVCYQTGRWEVDGVEVGDGDEAAIAFARVDLVQLVFTETCEHGWIYATACSLSDDDGVVTPLDEEEIQIGPEQLVAKLDTFYSFDQSLCLTEASLGIVG